MTVQWSLETLHEHVLSIIASNDRRYEERFAASQRAVELGLAGTKSEISAALAAADRAVMKAEVATEKRFEGVNEFRGALDQQQRTLIPRAEVDVLMKGIEQKIEQNTKQLDAQQKQLTAIAAERAGIKGGWGYAVGIVGFMLALGSLLMIGLKFLRLVP